jgi:intergrase/recombinase
LQAASLDGWRSNCKIRGEEGIRTPIDSLCSTLTSQLQNYAHLISNLDWDDYRKWLLDNKQKKYAQIIHSYSKKYHKLGFSNELATMPPTRKKLDVIKCVANLTRYLDIRNDTTLHEEFTAWLKRKEIKWSIKPTIDNYHLSEKQTLENVVETIRKLPYRYKIFALFVLVSGLRTEEAIRAFNNHSSLCHGGIMELFWDRGTKKANAVFCHPLLHDKINFKMSRLIYTKIGKRTVGYELRFLRKLNFTMVATEVDPLLAEFMQGRRGNVSQRHYFLPSMERFKKKYEILWSELLSNCIGNTTEII